MDWWLAWKVRPLTGSGSGWLIVQHRTLFVLVSTSQVHLILPRVQVCSRVGSADACVDTPHVCFFADCEVPKRRKEVATPQRKYPFAYNHPHPIQGAASVPCDATSYNYLISDTVPVPPKVVLAQTDLYGMKYPDVYTARPMEVLDEGRDNARHMRQVAGASRH